MTKVIDSFKHGGEVIHFTANSQIRIDELNGLLIVVPRESRQDLSGVLIAHIEKKSSGAIHKKYLIERGGLPLIATLTKKPVKEFDLRAPAFIRTAL